MRVKKILILCIISIVSSCQSFNKNSAQSNINKSTFDEIIIMERPLPDDRGVITYQDYQVLIANGNETVKQIAERLGIEANRLSSYNGVLLNYLPRKDETLALPIRISGEIVSRPSNWSAEGAKQAIKKSFGESKINIGTPDNPLRHRIESGDTAYSVARLYNISVTSLAKWNGLNTDLKLIVGRELIIPVAFGSSNSDSVSKNLDTKEKTKVINNEHKVEKNQNALKDQSDNYTKKEITDNNFESSNNSSSTQKTDNKPFVRPVDGKILRRYNPTATRNKNEGIDFYALPGTTIKAAADGVVALISKPVGGLGKIIILKHDKSIMSIYGRVKDLQVSKNSRVSQGQIIGKVEVSSDDRSNENYLHFELRKGTKSLDPEPLFR